MGRQTKTGDYEKENRQIDPASASQPSKRHVGATMACIEDIQGCYLVASSWPDYHPEFDIRDQLAEFVERIQDKLARNRNKTQHNWFTIAFGAGRLPSCGRNPRKIPSHR